MNFYLSLQQCEGGFFYARNACLFSQGGIHGGCIYLNPVVGAPRSALKQSPTLTTTSPHPQHMPEKHSRKNLDPMKKNSKHIAGALIGCTARIEFPGSEAVVEFTKQGKMHWKSTDMNTKTVTQGTESIAYQQFSETLFHVNWMDKTNISASQIIDLATNKVHMLLTYEEGKVTSSPTKIIGSFTLI